MQQLLIDFRANEMPPVHYGGNSDNQNGIEMNDMPAEG